MASWHQVSKHLKRFLGFNHVLMQPGAQTNAGDFTEHIVNMNCSSTRASSCPPLKGGSFSPSWGIQRSARRCELSPRPDSFWIWRSSRRPPQWELRGPPAGHTASEEPHNPRLPVSDVSVKVPALTFMSPVSLSLYWTPVTQPSSSCRLLTVPSMNVTLQGAHKQKLKNLCSFYWTFREIWSPLQLALDFRYF